MGLVDGEDRGNKHHEQMLQKLSSTNGVDDDYLTRLPSVFDDLERTHERAVSLISSLSANPSSRTDANSIPDVQPGRAKPSKFTPKTVFAISRPALDQKPETEDKDHQMSLDRPGKTKSYRRRQEQSQGKSRLFRKRTSSTRRTPSVRHTTDDIEEHSMEPETIANDVLEALDAVHSDIYDITDNQQNVITEQAQGNMTSTGLPSESKKSASLVQEAATYSSRLNEFLSTFFETAFGNDAETMLAVSQMTRKQTWEALNSKRQHFFTVIRALITRLNGTVAFLNEQFADQSEHQIAVSEYDFFMLRSNIVHTLQDLQKSAEFATSLRDQMGGIVDRSKEKEKTEERRLSMMELSTADSENKISISRQDLLEYLSHQQLLKKKLLNRHLKALRLARLDQARQSVFITAMKSDSQVDENPSSVSIGAEIVNAYNERRIHELEDRLRQLNALPAQTEPNPNSDPLSAAERGHRLISYVKSLEESHKILESELARANEQIDRLENTIRQLKMAIRRQLSGEVVPMESLATTTNHNEHGNNNSDEEEKDQDLRMRLNDTLTALDIMRSDLEKERRHRAHFEHQLQQFISGKIPLTKSSSLTSHGNDALSHSAHEETQIDPFQDKFIPKSTFEYCHNLKSTSFDTVSVSDSSRASANMAGTTSGPHETAISSNSQKTSSKHNDLSVKVGRANTLLPAVDDVGTTYQDIGVQTDPIKYPVGFGAKPFRRDHDNAPTTAQSTIATPDTEKSSNRNVIGDTVQLTSRDKISDMHTRSEQEQKSQMNANGHMLPLSAISGGNSHASSDKSTDNHLKLTGAVTSTTTSPVTSPRTGQKQDSHHGNHLMPQSSSSSSSSRPHVDMERHRRLLGRYFVAMCRIAMLNKLTKKAASRRLEPTIQLSGSLLQTHTLNSTFNGSANFESSGQQSPRAQSVIISDSPNDTSSASRVKLEMATSLTSNLSPQSRSQPNFMDKFDTDISNSTSVAATVRDSFKSNKLADNSIMLGKTGLAEVSITENRLSEETPVSPFTGSDSGTGHVIDQDHDEDRIPSSSSQERGVIERRPSLGAGDDQTDDNLNPIATLATDDLYPSDGSKPSMGWAAAASALRRKRMATTTATSPSPSGMTSVLPTPDVKRLRRVLDEREKELEATWKQVEELEALNQSLEDNIADLQAQIRGERAPQVLTDLRADNVRLQKEKAALLRENQDLCDQIASSLENEGEKVAGLITDSSLADQELKKRISKMEKMLQWWRQRWERMKRSKLVEDGGDAGTTKTANPSSITSAPSISSLLHSNINNIPRTNQVFTPKKPPPTLAVVNPIIPDPSSPHSIKNIFAGDRLPNLRNAASAAPAPAPKLKVFLKRIQKRSSLSSSNTPINLPDLTLDLLNGDHRSQLRSPTPNVNTDRIASARLSSLLPAKQVVSTGRNSLTNR